MTSYARIHVAYIDDVHGLLYTFANTSDAAERRLRRIVAKNNVERGPIETLSTFVPSTHTGGGITQYLDVRMPMLLHRQRTAESNDICPA
jgi:hypothetical protein